MGQTEATIERLSMLVRYEAFSKEAHQTAVAMVTSTPSVADWQQFLRRFAFGMGALHLVGAGVYFVAQNWWELGRFGQFALIEALFVGCCTLALWWGTERLAGKVAVSAAAGLIGPVFLVISSAYPSTGSMWQLLGLWAVLMVPFCLASRFAPLYLACLFVVDCTWLAGFEDIDQLFDDVPFALPGFGLFALNVSAMWAWEAAARFRDSPWLAARWPVRAMGASAMMGLTLGVLPTLWGDEDIAGMLGLLLMLPLIALFQGLYWRKAKDLFLAAVPLLMGIFVLANGAARLLLDVLATDLAILFGFPMVALFTVVITVAALAWLRLGMTRGSAS